MADYFAAVQGAHVVTVDNASGHTTAQALVEMTTHLSGEYIRNAENRGFAAANNQGYAVAKGDIIIFLNSDVAPTGPWLSQVAADVRDGALYGPSLAAQLVAGRHLPYIEGWCIAATKKTWENLGYARDKAERGWRQGLTADGRWLAPWDEDAYPGPYWEDNDLCLRALSQGIALVQTQWSIAHKGGQTAGPIMRHARSFAENERTFTDRVLQAITPPSMSPTWQKYMQAYHTPSDIQAHVGLLYSLARGNVVELGTRSGVSTAALLAGVEAHGGHVWSVDLTDYSSLFQHDQWTFIQGDSRDAAIASTFSGDSPYTVVDKMPINLLLVDTEHTFENCSAELALWSDYMAPGGTILLHDPETFPGVRRAVKEFCQAKGWNVTFILPCNGMAVVEVPK